jgi:carboxymethylenebutenolidase
VVIQDARGVGAYLESVCERFALAGWHAVAPHLYHRDGVSVVPPDGDVMAQLGRLTGHGLTEDVDASLQHLVGAGLPFWRVGIVGFCMGGTVALATGARLPLAAAVSFYGGAVMQARWEGVPPLVQVAPKLQTPWLGLYGAEDPSIPRHEALQLEAAANEAHVPTELHLYEGAGHAFHSDDRPEMYHAEAAEDAWKRALAWLDRHAGPS